MSVDLTTVDAAAFRALFRHHASGVVVITLDAGDGPVGFTATSLTSVSLEPPLVTFVIADGSASWPHVRSAQTVVVNFLGHGHHELAQQFATTGIDRFAAPVRWHRLTTGEPALDEPGRRLMATIRDRIRVGDHHLIVAEIHGIEVDPARVPSSLVYHAGRFQAVGHE